MTTPRTPWYLWCPYDGRGRRYIRFDQRESSQRIGMDPYHTGRKIIPACPTIDLLIEAVDA